MGAEESRPFEFEVPEGYEQQIDDARAGLEVVPRNENWEIAQRVLAEPPSREAIEQAQRAAAEAMAALAAFQERKHTGYDPDQVVKIVLDAAGRLDEIAIGVDAVRIGNHAVAEAVGAAWRAAEEARAEAGSDFAKNARSGGGDAAAEAGQVMRDIEAAIEERAGERFERVTEDGLCRIAVDLRGKIAGVVFLHNNVLNLTDRQTLAEQITAAVTAAQSEASAVVGEISAAQYARLG